MSVDELVIDVILDPVFELESASTVVDVEPVEPILSVITVEGPKGDDGATGPAGDGAQIVGEHPTGTQDGANTVFTTAHMYRAGSTAVYLNGLREFNGDGYTETTSTTITFDDPPSAADTIRIDYLTT